MKMTIMVILTAAAFAVPPVSYSQNVFSLGGDIHSLPLIINAESRAITQENPQGLPGAGGKEKEGRKGAPCYRDLAPGKTFALMDIPGCGVIRHIWITVRPDKDHYRNAILRIYWDGSDAPSVEAPLLDFFGEAHGVNKPLASSLTTITEGRGLNCYFPMPFAKGAKITLENDSESGISSIYYQIDYDLLPSLPENTGRFHAQFRRQNPTVLKQDYVLVDNIDAPGVYIGTVIGVRAKGTDWWGEGEMKFYVNGDDAYPTICGTGTEDYFGSAWGLGTYQTLYHGCTLTMKTDEPANYISLYRWHAADPIRFKSLRKVTIQQIGWSDNGLYERSDDWCSMAYWYQIGINKHFPKLPSRQERSADLPAPEKDE
ncbi:MAG: glycoside hydrolase family 172 protein [Candidatus Omnitrophota bacterium]